MYVCICKQVTEQQIKNAIKEGINTVSDIAAELGASSDCGSCVECVQDLITEHYSEYLVAADNISILDNNISIKNPS